MYEPEYRKVYVDVFAVMKRDGTVLPRSFVWEDGERYTIDRVLHIVPAASLKVGGRGIRYTVKIGRTSGIFSGMRTGGSWRLRWYDFFKA